jgi:Na+/proline symporter
MNAYTAGIVASIAVYLIVGNYAGRKVKHLDDYFVAGRQAPTLLIVGTLVASLMSTTAFMGEAGMSYSGYGTLIVLLTGINSTGYVAGALFFGRYLRRSRALTVAEYFGKRFDSRRVQAVAGATLVVGLTGYLMAVTQGASLLISEVTPVPYGLSLLVVWLGYTIFTLYSGSRGVILTDTMMFLLFSFVSVLGLAYILGASGGASATVRQLASFAAKPGIIAWHGMNGPDANWQTPGESLTWALILGVAWGVVVAVSPWQASRYLMARDEHTVVRAGCGAAASIMLLYVVIEFASAAVNLSNPDIDPPEGALIWAAMNLMPTFAGVLLMTGIVAAALSSASTFLSLVGFSASNDIFARHASDERAQLRVTRLAMFGLSLVAVVLAFLVPPRIFWITYFAGTVFASSWGPVAFMSVWSRRITEAAAFWGLIAGFVANIGTNLLALFGVVELPVYLDPIFLGAVASFAVIWIVSRRGSISEAELAFREQLHRTPDAERDADRVRRSLLWPKWMIAAGIALSAALIEFYARPYQQAVGAAGAAVSGELVLAGAYGCLLIGSAVLARWGIRRFYTARPADAVARSGRSGTSSE